MSKVRSFLLPEMNKRFVIRLSVIALSTFLLFTFILQASWINGFSMEPTYRDGRFLLINRLAYSFRKARVGEIVLVRLGGEKLMYLKRVVALAGDTLEFRAGVLYVNGQLVQEDYVKSGCSWSLEVRKVKPGYVYVIGDNRGMSIDEHKFGATPELRIAGSPLW